MWWYNPEMLGTGPLFLWYPWVSSVKAKPQCPKYPNVRVKSYVTSEKPILEFNPL
jgi:hypothetical protein